MITVICTNPKNFNITKNKEYEILDENENRITIRNDKDSITSYSKKLFEFKKEELPALTLDEILANVKIDKNEFALTLPKYDINFNYRLANYFTSHSTSGAGCSCGVKGRSSINSLYSLWNETKSSFTDLYKKLNEYTDDDYQLHDELFIKALKSLFNDILGHKVSGNETRGFHLIISLKHNDFSPYFLKRICEEYPVNASIINANSNNLITTFIIDRMY